VRAVSRLEADGWIARANERYRSDARFRRTVDGAHRAYAIEREAVGGEAGSGGVGGTRTGIKCLHAHLAYALVGGDDPVGAEVAAALGPVHRDRDRVAAIDQGTNSTRVLVLEPGPDGATPTEIARDMVITRLGRGVDEAGRLDDAAARRTLEAIAREVRRATALGATRVRVGLTSAVRDAADRDDFVAAVRGVAPRADVEILSGEREAALSFRGATSGIDPGLEPYLVADIGGGSTELVVGRTPGIVERASSIQVGSVRMTERWIRHDPPWGDEIEAIADEARRRIDPAAVQVDAASARTVVLVGGTATTTQAVALGLDVHDPDVVDRSWLTLADARRTRDRFVSMTNAERSALAVMPSGRGDVITAGATILVTLLERLGARRALVSERDILDGLAWELLGVG
jgi:exopolyphosphatase/guanosine-5'-triphosphate,3'-diphosphate pyrophosphatase